MSCQHMLLGSSAAHEGSVGRSHDLTTPHILNCEQVITTHGRQASAAWQSCCTGVLSLDQGGQEEEALSFWLYGVHLEGGFGQHPCLCYLTKHLLFVGAVGIRTANTQATPCDHGFKFDHTCRPDPFG